MGYGHPWRWPADTRLPAPEVTQLDLADAEVIADFVLANATER